MKVEDRQALADMLTFSHQALDLLGDRDATAVQADLRTRYALTHVVTLLGEAARRVDDSCRGAAPLIPWRSIVGMRNQLIHRYPDIDVDLLVDAVRKRVPPLIVELERILNEGPQNG